MHLWNIGLGPGWNLKDSRHLNLSQGRGGRMPEMQPSKDPPLTLGNTRCLHVCTGALSWSLFRFSQRKTLILQHTTTANKIYCFPICGCSLRKARIRVWWAAVHILLAVYCTYTNNSLGQSKQSGGITQVLKLSCRCLLFQCRTIRWANDFPWCPTNQ